MDKCELTESFFSNPENIKLYRQIYKPKDLPINAVVFLSHGLFEHCQAVYFEPIIKPLIYAGCVVLTHDHYGHGRSEGNRGMISDMNILVRDVKLDLEATIKDLNLKENLPIFIYGHSMGGLIAVLATLENKEFFKGMILESPALAHNVNQITICLGRCISCIFPSCPLKGMNYDDICRDAKHVEIIKNDPLRIHSKVSAMTGVALINAITYCREHWKEVDTPVIIGHGDADQLTLASGSKMFIEEISSADKTLIIYPNAKHQLRMEIDNVNIEFCEKIISWLKERIN